MITRLTAVGLLSLFLFACGDDDGGSSPGGNGGAGGTGGSGSGSAAAGNKGGTNLNLKLVTCDRSPTKCQISGEDTDEGVESRKTSCTENGGKVVEHCPSEGLAGCCMVGQVGTCTYDASVAPTIAGICPQQGGTWRTDAP